MGIFQKKNTEIENVSKFAIIFPVFRGPPDLAKNDFDPDLVVIVSGTQFQIRSAIVRVVLKNRSSPTKIIYFRNFDQGF